VKIGSIGRQGTNSQIRLVFILDQDPTMQTNQQEEEEVCSICLDSLPKLSNFTRENISSIGRMYIPEKKKKSDAFVGVVAT